MRKSWSECFMDLALSIATRSTCDRAFVGCVLVNPDNRIVSIGYNGVVSGDPHCDETSHTLRGGHCIAMTRAGMDALLYCVKEGIAVKGCICYATHFPCLNYTKSLVQAGISRIYCHETYCVGEYTIELLGRNNIEYVQI